MKDALSTPGLANEMREGCHPGMVDCILAGELMQAFVPVLVFLAIYVILMRWVLPRLGVPT